jgi:hypothetical protein
MLPPPSPPAGLRVEYEDEEGEGEEEEELRPFGGSSVVVLVVGEAKQ